MAERRDRSRRAASRRGGAAARRCSIATWRSGSCDFGAAWGALRAVEGSRGCASADALAAATGAGLRGCRDGCADVGVDACRRRRAAAGTPAQLELLRRLGSERARAGVRRCRRSTGWPSPTSPQMLRIEPRAVDDARGRRPERSTAVPDRVGAGRPVSPAPRGAARRAG